MSATLVIIRQTVSQHWWCIWYYSDLYMQLLCCHMYVMNSFQIVVQNLWCEN